MAIFEMEDNQIYDDLWSVVPASLTVEKGDPAMRQDCFGFYFKNCESVTEEVIFVYRMRQVHAAKKTGTGEAIISGDRLWYIFADEAVTPTKPGAGTPGIDYAFCGWAKQNAGASDTTVWMNFDGTLYDTI